MVPNTGTGWGKNMVTATRNVSKCRPGITAKQRGPYCFELVMFNIFKMSAEMKLNGVNVIQLPKNFDRRGNLSVVEEIRNIPFKIKRAYWIYDVPGGEVRGGHAYQQNQEFIVALSGSFDVILDSGTEQKTYSLNRSYYGLYVPKGVWRQMENFSTNSLALILASIPFDPKDYIYDYDLFKEISNEGLINPAR